MTDPIIDELWRIKDGLARDCGYNVHTLAERLKAIQRAHPERVVNRQAQRRACEPDQLHVAEVPADYGKDGK